MQQTEDGLLYSASDLLNFLGCRHATFLDLIDLETPLPRAVDDPQLRLHYFSATRLRIISRVYQATPRLPPTKRNTRGQERRNASCRPRPCSIIHFSRSFTAQRMRALSARAHFGWVESGIPASSWMSESSGIDSILEPDYAESLFSGLARACA